MIYPCPVSSPSLQYGLALLNQKAVQALLDAGQPVCLPAGEFPFLPVSTSRAGALTGVPGTVVYQPYSTTVIAQPLFDVAGCPFLFDSVELFANPGGAALSTLVRIRRTASGSDPGVKFHKVKGWGKTSKALVWDQGSELAASFDCTWGQDGSGDCWLVEEFGSTTRFSFHGGQLTNYGGQGALVRCRGNVQELLMFGTYLAGGKSVVTEPLPGVAGTPECSGFLFSGVRAETAQPMADTSLTWAKCFAFTACSQGGQSPMLKCRTGALDMVIDPSSRQLTTGVTGDALKQEVQIQ